MFSLNLSFFNINDSLNLALRYYTLVAINNEGNKMEFTRTEFYDLEHIPNDSLFMMKLSLPLSLDTNKLIVNSNL